MQTRVQVGDQPVELGFRVRFVSVMSPENTMRGICCVVSRPGAPLTVSDEDLVDSLRLRVPGLAESLVVCVRGASKSEWVAFFFGSEEFSRAPAPARVEIFWIRGNNEVSLGYLHVDNCIVHVHWNCRLVGVLSGIVIDQPYYHGVWDSADDPAFEQEFRSVQACIGPTGIGMLKVTFQDSDGKMVPARAMIRPGPETAPYFRFGFPGDPERLGK